MPYILSPEQKVVVDAILCNETSSTKYFDLVSALQALSKSCTSSLGKGQKILLHIADIEQKNMLKNMFAQNGLDDLMIDISDKQSMPEVDIIKLRSTLKKTKDTDAIITSVLSNKKAKSSKNQVEKFYKSFDTKVLADTPFRDFATNAIYNKKKGRPIILVKSTSDNLLDFTASEYYKIKKEISSAASIFEQQFDLFDHLSFFTEELWDGINSNKVQEIKDALTLFRNESLQLSNAFIKVSNQLQENSTKETTIQFSHLEEKFLNHEDACLAFHIKNGANIESKDTVFSLFKKKKSQPSNKIYIDAFDELSGLIKVISQEWYDELDAPTTEAISYEYILGFIKNNSEKISEYREKIVSNLQSGIQRINKINTSSQEVKMLDKRLEEFIQKINDSALFNLDLEHNILSFSKQAELSKNISDYIEKCYVLVHSSSTYLEWKSFYNATGDIFKLVFDAIKKIPKNLWIESFEQWYENQIQNHVLDKNKISSTDLNVYFDHASKSNQVEISAIIGQLHSDRLAGAEQLKSTNKELYNTLFKKKQLPSVSWHDTALMNRPFMQAFFPIHFVDTLSHAKDYDLVISFTPKQENEESHIHYFSPIESKDIQNMSAKKDNFLYLNDYNYSGTLTQLSSTDKLKASKKLAKFILSLNQNIKIYQLKNANIISLLPSHDDSCLENELDKINVKVIDTNGVLYDRLTESFLLTERSPFLIIKDNLINSELSDHVLWQLKLLQLFKDVGYQIISLDTTDQLIDNAGQFDKIMQKIGGIKPDKIVNDQDVPAPTVIAEEA